MKFQGNAQRESKVNIDGGNSLINGPLGQMMAFSMLQKKQQEGQNIASNQAPQGMLNTEFSGPLGNRAVNPEAEAKVAAIKASALAPIEIDKAVKKKLAEEANDAIIKGNTAINQLQYGVSRFKALQDANKTQEGMPGLMQRAKGMLGQAKGAIGLNPEEQAWNEYARTVATQLSAAASPRTPTLLVEYYQHALGGADQTYEEFSRRIHNIVSEQKARQSAYSGTPYSQKDADEITGKILAVPAAKDPRSFFPKDNSDTNIPQAGPQTSLQSDPLDGKVIVNPSTKIRLKRQGGKWQPIQ